MRYTKDDLFFCFLTGLLAGLCIGLISRCVEVIK